MLLIGVDLAYENGASEYRDKAPTIFRKTKISWPAILEPNGWEGVLWKFNITGYGSTLVDPQGIVRGTGISPRELESLLKEIYPDQK